jgi:hypothetical protein
MLLINPTNSDCPGCGVARGRPHADGCDIQLCSACGTQRHSCSCEAHDPRKAIWKGLWIFPTGVDVEDQLEETSGQQSVPSFLVNLYAAFETWNPDNLWDRPFIVRFDGFEEAKVYVVKNLEDVIHIFSNALKDVRKAQSLEELDISWVDLITEER